MDRINKNGTTVLCYICQQSRVSHLPLSHECRRTMAYRAEEAERLGRTQIGTEHLLLGLLREEGCV
jgi:hypothetical protein